MSAPMGICSGVKQWADLNIKRCVTRFPSLFVLFFSFIIYLRKILVGKRCHSSRVNHLKSLTAGNNLFNLPVRNYEAGHVNVSRTVL